MQKLEACGPVLFFGVIFTALVGLIPYKTTKVSIHTGNVHLMHALREEGILIKESCGEFIGTTDATFNLGYLMFGDVGSILYHSKKDDSVFFITDEKSTTIHADYRVK